LEHKKDDEQFRQFFVDWLLTKGSQVVKKALTSDGEGNIFD
jgi:hypothetical protein